MLDLKLFYEQIDQELQELEQNENEISYEELIEKEREESYDED